MSPYYRVKCRHLIVCMSLCAPTWWRRSSGINVISVAGRTWIGRSSQSGHVQFASCKEMADLLQQDKGQLLAVDFLDRIAIRSRRCGKFLPSSRRSSVCLSVCLFVGHDRETYNKKLSYRQGTARCVVSVEILPVATQQWRNDLYDKSWTKYQLSLIDPCDKIVLQTALNDLCDDKL